MNKDLLEIVNGLIEKSKEKGVLWVHGSSLSETNLEGNVTPEDEDFAVHTPTYTINIFKRSVPAPGIGLNIHNEFGNIVTQENLTPDDSDFDKLWELFTLAKRYVFDEDKLLEKIKESLKSPGVLGAAAPDDGIHQPQDF
jgi:hypothetical protein